MACENYFDNVSDKDFADEVRKQFRGFATGMETSLSQHTF